MDVRELFERYHLNVFRYMLRMTGSRETAEDLTQDVFVRVSRNLAGYTEMGRERAWIFSIAANVFRNSKREAVRRLSPRDARSVDSIEDSLSANEPADRVSLEEALSSLGEKERQVFLMRELGGLSYAEIAAITGLSVGSVRNRIYRARMSLRDWLTRGSRSPRGWRMAEERS
jgi:RNA polymerase sigma factor (sigma-70 family)